MIQKKIFIILLLVFSFKCLSEEEILVSAERVLRPKKYLTSSNLIITNQMLQESSAFDLSGLLEEYAGLSSYSNGGMGAASSSLLRGGNSDYIMVLIDGVSYEDGTRPSGGADFSNIDLAQIEKIEIIKDNASALYGAGAISGLVKITTKKKKTIGSRSDLLLSSGSHNLSAGSINHRINNGKFDSSITAHWLYTDGISSYNNDRQVHKNAEKDSFTKFGGSFSLGYKISKFKKIELSMTQYKSKKDFDAIGGDALFLFDKYAKRSLGIQYHHGLFSGILNSKNNFKKIITKRFSSSSFGKTLSTSKNYHIKNSQTLLLNENQTLFFGVDFLNEAIANDTSFLEFSRNYYSVFLGDNIKLDNFFLDLAIRKNYTKAMKAGESYKVGFGVIPLFFKKLTFKINISNGNKLPTLYQLFDIYYGTKDLKTIESLSKSLTIEYKYQKIYFDVSFFETDYKNEITYDFNSEKFKNIGKSQVQGYEINSSFIYPSNIDWSLSLIKLLARDLSQNQYLKRRPKIKIHFNQKISLNEKNKLEFKTSYIGRRDNINSAVGGHVINDFVFSHKRNKRTNLRLNIENLLDRDYEEIHTYGTYGRTYKINIGFKF